MFDADSLRVAGRRLLVGVVVLDAILILSNAIDPVLSRNTAELESGGFYPVGRLSR